MRVYALCRCFLQLIFVLIGCIIPRASVKRSVAQPGRALRSGRRGRWFEPSHSDHFFGGMPFFLFFVCNLLFLNYIYLCRKRERHVCKTFFEKRFF